MVCNRAFGACYLPSSLDAMRQRTIVETNDGKIRRTIIHHSKEDLKKAKKSDAESTNSKKSDEEKENSFDLNALFEKKEEYREQMEEVAKLIDDTPNTQYVFDDTLEIIIVSVLLRSAIAFCVTELDSSSNDLSADRIAN